MAPILLLLAALGVVAFLAVSSTAPFKDKFLSSLFPKSFSRAETAPIPTPFPNCQPYGTEIPAGQSDPPMKPVPMNPIWCFPLGPEPISRVAGANDWVDNFDTNLQMGQLNDHDMDYRIFNTAPEHFQAGQFAHNNHWMVDMAEKPEFVAQGLRLSGGILLSPDKTFKFENGKLVVETDVAAGSDGLGGADRFVEIDISPAAAPTGTVVDSLYGYGQFGLVGSLGCRLEKTQWGGNVVCARYDDSGRDAGGTSMTGGANGLPGRLWETQGIGVDESGSDYFQLFPTNTMPGTSLIGNDVWRQCNANDSDAFCRDRFRFEFTKDSVVIYVNGHEWYHIKGLYKVNPGPQAPGVDNTLPDSWLTNGVRVYLSTWENNSGLFVPNSMRAHWDRIAINPHNADGSPAGLSAAPNWCPGQPYNTCGATVMSPTPSPSGSTPAPTSSGAPASTPTPTPTAVSSASPAPSSPPQQGNTLGNTNIGSVVDNNDSNSMNGARFTTTTGGPVSSLSVYVNNVDSSPNNQYQLAIYADNNGVPSSLVASSSTGALKANSWNTLPVVATLSPNTSYWLMANSNGTSASSNTLRYDAGGTGGWSAFSTTFGSWPNPFGHAQTAAQNFSIYATLGSSGGPLPTPTPTPTSTPTITPAPTSTSQPISGKFNCTLSVGYSQTYQWFNGANPSYDQFQNKVGDGNWELLWVGGGAARYWADPSFVGWNNSIESGCSQNADSPDRILLDITHDAYLDQNSSAVSDMVQIIRQEINTVQSKFPSVKQIVLQPVVGGPNDGICQVGGVNVRASVNHPIILDAVRQVANGTSIVRGYDSMVDNCSEYSDNVGHLTDPDGRLDLAVKLGTFYSGSSGGVSPTPVPTANPIPTPTATPSGDTQIPSTPGNLTGNAVSTSQVNLMWSASNDNVGVTGYDIYRDNVQIATTVSTSLGDSGLLPSTSYNYYVIARDAAGNSSSPSNTVTVTTPAAATPTPTASTATTGTISGIVTRSDTGGALYLAKVCILNAASRCIKTVYTNASGQYSLTDVTAGNVRVRYAKGSKFVTQTLTVSVAAGTTTVKNVTLQRK